ncbi:hypothetical protein PW5551_01780 [Petrotoga sp. 9PW.55.5.1]|uniref:polysaccharide biosynthesis/export family protein n=1 Tax=Petrotoga sp. 9PW.55.5.1 TaxID=1308979 RepID=UPI000DC52333|nr:polysaccharide biosynthesis/export family protein [Petrotoga sp. 9PW.55.5.1]RAO99784.1 hypothetical protein PW5551_01780 [Petrotoga sp. 9PW.55.5.1]
MKKSRFYSIVFLFLLLPLISLSYSVRIGDVLGVWVLGYPEYSVTNLIVGPNGNITVPPIGRIKAEGRTLDDLESEISLKMENYLKTNKVTVGILNYAPFSVTVLGNTNVNGVIDIKTEQIKLSDLIGLAGGIRDITKSSYAIIKSPDGVEQKVSIEWLKSGEKSEDPIIYEDYFVLFPYDYTNKITVFSNFGTASMDYHEGLTLKSVISSMNIPTNKIDKEIVVIRDSKIEEIPFETVLKEQDYYLKSGDTIIIPQSYTNQVLVFSDFGSTSLDYYEGLTLKTLISSLNVQINKIDDIISVIRNGKTYTVSIDNISKGEEFLLNSGDTVVINEYQNYVYINSQEVSKRVDFEKDEKMDVRTLLTKVGISQDNIDEIRVNNKLYTLNSQLSKGDFVEVSLKRNYVYTSGAFNTSGKIGFLPTEKITMDKLIGMVKGFSQDFSGNLIIINDTGLSKTIKVDTNNLSSLKDIEVSPGSTIIADTEIRMAYVFGEFPDLLEYTQGQNLYELLLPYNLDESYEVRYQISNKNGKVNAMESETLKNIPLEGKVFIEISKVSPNQVIVYKAGNTQTIQQRNVRLIDVYSTVGGFSPVDKGTIAIYKDNEKLKTITSDELLDNMMLEIPKGSYVVVQPEASGSFIAVLGNISSPKSIKAEIPLNLVEILSQAQIDWKHQQSIFIYNQANEEKKVDIKNIDSLRNVLVEPGSIVYIPPLEEQVVYVFGEVVRPGLVEYNSGMTVLDAILKAGNASNSAQLSTVYLFKEGPENPPITLDLSGIIKASPVKTGMNPEVKPKDIIYVPKNALKSIVEVMSTVKIFMDFVNSGLNTYNNVSGLF